MTEEKPPSPAPPHTFVHTLDRSAIVMIVGIILLFSTAIIVTLVAPRYVDSTWTSPSSSYQLQMYEIHDPHFYIRQHATNGNDLQYVHHLKQGFTLLAFKESDTLRLIAPPHLEKFITRHRDAQLKLTSRLLLLRKPEGDMQKVAEDLLMQWQKQASSEEQVEKKSYQILELYDPQVQEAFSWDHKGGIFQNWVDQDFVILDDTLKHPYHQDRGVIYVQNPSEFRIRRALHDNQEEWNYDPEGQAIASLEELKSSALGFRSRQELISLGEHLYAIEGCWYCHTDQTRTLIEDVVLNGTDAFPAPPSSANEYIYQKISFPGTRRIGPDLSREGIKRPSRDWHKVHFWAPKTAVVGSIMPAFQHFFDRDPRGTHQNAMGIPNIRFEAMYQYLMTKGTRITPPNQAWWLGKDPIRTKEIIQGERKLP